METLVLKLILCLHGALGAVVLLMVEKTKDFSRGLRMLVVSGVCSAIITPGLAEHYGWKIQTVYAAGLLIGLSCWKLIQGVILLLNKFSKDPTTIIDLIWKRKT